MLKYGEPNIQQKIITLFEKIINIGIIPQEWKTSIIIPIFTLIISKETKERPKQQ
jgi:hypothetical protein